MLRIDSHHHLWDLSVRPQSWMDDDSREAIGGPYTLAQWDEVATAAGVSHGVFVQTVADASETPEVLALAADHQQLAAVVGWIDISLDPRPAGEQLDELLAAEGGSRLAGIRIAAEYSADPDWLDSPEVRALARALAERQLTLDLLMTPAHLPAAARLAGAHPETLTIINHLAKPSMRNADFAAWSRGLAAFSGLEQVACKLSGFLTFDRFPATATRLAPYTDAALETFGTSRMLFGSDWPVNVLGGGYATAVSITEEILAPLSETERAEVWSGTARRVYPALDRTLSHQIGPRF